MSGVLLGHKNPFRWRGYEYEEDTTLYYLVTRFYDSILGRFITEDDYAFLGASGNTVSYNLYTYCENDPVNNVDYLGYKAIDITKRLTKTMLNNAMYLYFLGVSACLLGPVGLIGLMYKFYTLVKSNGKWDLKRQKEWKLSSGDHYVFMGEKLNAEDVGNIHFGFVGSVLFSLITLCAGAGVYQVLEGKYKKEHWYTFFDQPRDTRNIVKGRLLWRAICNLYVLQL